MVPIPIPSPKRLAFTRGPHPPGKPGVGVLSERKKDKYRLVVASRVAKSPVTSRLVCRVGGVIRLPLASNSVHTPRKWLIEPSLSSSQPTMTLPLFTMSTDNDSVPALLMPFVPLM